ncbi:MAG: triose-phosphate isomerase [Acidobacteria bacterium]|nr:triose-phosphate isomerase [Acidobacteriota bacterium]
MTDRPRRTGEAVARKPIIAGNWKMNLNHLEAIALVQKAHYHLREKDYDAVEVVVCPPFTSLRSVQTLIEGDRIPIALGAQSCHWEEKGAFTGEVSPAMLARLKCSYVIAGHSERRALFGETDEVVNRKAKTIIAHGMTPIVCVGERLEEREAGRTEEVVGAQVRGSLAGITREQLGAIVVAYEPVWAIGTGRTARPEDAGAVVGFIRGVVGEIGGTAAADSVRIQYGGSVTEGNVADIMAQHEIDGALVGGASLDAEKFALIVRYRD